MASKLPRLATTRYVEPDAYIGQLFRATSGVALSNVRYPCIIGKGDRLFQMKNMPIRRSFRYEEPITFDTVTYRAPLDYDADGRQDGSVRLFNSKGIEISYGRWNFVDSNSDGKLDSVEISPESFEMTEAYFIDYQSIDRTVLDPLPFDNIRQIKYLSLVLNNEQYKEYKDYYIPDTFGQQFISWGDPVDWTVTNYENEVIDVDTKTTGTKTFTGKYNRKYHFKCLAKVPATSVTLAWRADASPCVYGTDIMPSTPVNIADPTTWPQVTVNDGSAVEIEGLLTITPDQALISLNDVFSVIGQSVPLVEIDDRYENPSVFAAASAVYKSTLEDLALGDWGVAYANDKVYISDISSFASLYNRKVSLICTAKTPGVSITFRASRTGIEGETAAVLTYDLTEATPTETFDGADIVVMPDAAVDIGDVLFYMLYAPKIFCHAKDDRSYKFTCLSATSGSVALRYNTDTQEGGFGLVNNGANIEEGWSGKDGQFILRGNVFFYARNTKGYASVITDNGGTFTAGTIICTVNGTPYSQLFNTDKDTTMGLLAAQIAADSNVSSCVYNAALHTITIVSLVGKNIVATVNVSGITGTMTISSIVVVGNRWRATDVLRFGNFDDAPGIKCDDYVNWDLTKKITGEVQDVLMDQNGSVTGEPGTYYCILNNIPINESSIKISGMTSADFSLVELGKAYIEFTAEPAADTVTVSYEYAGNEPIPGQLYYITANILRPLSMYDTPIRTLTPEETTAHLSPSTINNDLLIAAEAMWETSPPGLYHIQVRDSDDDGIFTKTDYERATESSTVKKDITDKIVLNAVLESLPKLMAVNVIDNDPFNKREEYIWIGPETDMEIGDADTEDSIIYTARKTLQVYGNSPAHGTRILHGSRWAKKSIVLDDGTEALVNLDGSFIAAYLAAKNASFADQSETLLRKTITGFDEIEVHDDQINRLFGANSIVYFKEIGQGVYRIEEDITVDTFNQNVHLINCMNQYHDVIKIVRSDMANNLISLVPPDVETGIGLVKAQLVGSLRSLVSRGRVANYQNKDGSIRDFDLNADVVVEIDESDTTLYHFWYCFFTKKPIKRLFGLVSIDTNNFSVV